MKIFIIMPEENINQEFRLRKIDEIRHYLIEEINRNGLMSKKHKKGCRVLNYVDYSLIAICAITGSVSIFAFASLVGIPVGITSFAIGLNICVMTAAIKKYKLIIKKKIKKKHNTRGRLNDWGDGNIFWKLTTKGWEILIKLAHLAQLILFTQFSQSIFLFQCVLPSFSTIKCAISHDNCTEKASVQVNKSKQKLCFIFVKRFAHL